MAGNVRRLSRIILATFLLALLIPMGSSAPSLSYDKMEDTSHFSYSPSNLFGTSISYDWVSGYGHKSIQVSNLTFSGSTRYITDTAITNYPSGKKVLGMWFKWITGNIGHSYPTILMLQDIGTGHYMSMSIGYTSSWVLIYAVNGAGGSSTTTVGLTINSWLWLEMCLNTTNLQTFYINGTGIGSKAGYGLSMGSNCRTLLAYASGASIGEYRMDYLWLSNEEDYPPPFPEQSLTILCIDQATGLNFSLPVYFNGSLHYSPHSENVTYLQNVTIRILEIREYNKTHSYVFKNWADGSKSSTRTYFMDSDQSATAYYLLVRKWDPGGWINFGIGLLGLLMMGASWLFLYHFWTSKEYAKALVVWIALFIVGFGFFTVMLGA